MAQEETWKADYCKWSNSEFGIYNLVDWIKENCFQSLSRSVTTIWLLLQQLRTLRILGKSPTTSKKDRPKTRTSTLCQTIGTGSHLQDP